MDMNWFNLVFKKCEENKWFKMWKKYMDLIGFEMVYGYGIWIQKKVKNGFEIGHGFKSWFLKCGQCKWLKIGSGYSNGYGLRKWIWILKLVLE